MYNPGQLKMTSLKRGMARDCKMSIGVRKCPTSLRYHIDVLGRDIVDYGTTLLKDDKGIWPPEDGRQLGHTNGIREHNTGRMTSLGPRFLIFRRRGRNTIANDENNTPIPGWPVTTSVEYWGGP